MTEWEGSYPKKTPEQIAKEKRESNRHAIRLALFFVITMTLIIGSCAYFQNPRESSKIIGRIIRSLKPYANLSFEKVNSKRPSLIIPPILGRYRRLTNLNTYIAYDSGNIYVYDSLDMQTLINKIPINGKITNVSCLVNDAMFAGLMNLVNDQDGKVNDPAGLYVFCQYTSKNSTRLICLCVPSIYYYAYAYSKNPNDKDLKFYKDLYFSFQQLPQTNANVKMIGTVDFDEKAKHPGKVLAKRFDIPIGESGFLCCLEGRESIHIVCKDQHNNLLFYDGTGYLSGTVKIGHNFIPTVDYYIGGSMICIFDGHKMAYYYGPTTSEQYLLDKPIELTDARFLPSSIEHYGSHSHFFINDNKLCYIIPIDDKAKLYKLVTKEFGSKEQINFKYKNYFDLEQKHYIAQMEGEDYYGIDYKIISQNYLFFDIPDVYSDSIDAEIGGFYISPALDTQENKNNPCVIMYANEQFFIVRTRGIDEPVDEAHVTYEDGRLTVYFMNKNSIYRWQNSQVGIDNLKLRKLDIKPEPIKTTQK